MNNNKKDPSKMLMNEWCRVNTFVPGPGRQSQGSRG